jgi:hypothetical protein
LRQSEAIVISTNHNLINDVQGKKPDPTHHVVAEQNTPMHAHESIPELIILERIEIPTTQPPLVVSLEMSHENLPLNSALPQENLVVEGTRKLENLWITTMRRLAILRRQSLLPWKPLS